MRYSRALIRSKNGRPTANGAAKRLCLLAVIESTHSMPHRARREQGGRKLESWLAGELPPSLPVRRGGCWLALLFALSLFFFTFAPSATVETSASACVTDPERPRDRVRRRRRRAQPPGGRPDDPEVAPGPRPDPQVSPPGRFFARTLVGCPPSWRPPLPWPLAHAQLFPLANSAGRGSRRGGKGKGGKGKPGGIDFCRGSRMRKNSCVI